MKGRGEYNDPIMRHLNARGLARVLTKVATLASLLILLAAVAAWLVTKDGGVWRALQGPHTSYVTSISGGYLTFQIASKNPDPERPATLGWQWFGGPMLPFLAVGSLADPSIFSRVGLFRTM